MSEPVCAYPVGGVDYPRTFQELLEWFPDDSSCLAYLERLRWPQGFVCPVCGAPGGWRTAKAKWMCTRCGRQTSVTAGTIFHRLRTPLSTWFAAIWFITSQKNGMSAQGLQRVLGFGSYETAWAWLQKLRRAMVRPERELLSGVVELDEVFIGNESRGRAGGVKDHTAAMIAVESIPGRKLGRVRIELAETARSVSMLGFADRVIAKGSTVRTDDANYLKKLTAAGYEHVAFVGTDSAEPAHINLPGVHMVASLLKRWLTGTLHYAVSQEHLAYYLDEYTFRFNRRTSKSRGLLFYRLLQQAVNTDPHPLAELRNPVAAVDVPF
ncbi:IS1595 family transposase [Nakamurella sp. PAMC28650]|uniref:IS1595 family transposase n=1 Tax=Nakamurella sp. PAMC28650 TaxID=2762325 RepID=UPI00164ED398|nr:IS1595 family transposase [Nakamurella sp. PAMC28650]QNK79463.1 IS1595 family transposase [Nakamurella sp. PAMC28650]QNK79575.1 IS1595 family transposase [Nakamurella sp. PAMC28650]QNK81512.1 IS1595 family transposase [Nakamurella sp. PAMC28650]